MTAASRIITYPKMLYRSDSSPNISQLSRAAKITWEQS